MLTCCYLVTNVDGEQQAEEAGGGVAPMTLQPGLIDVLEEGGTVDHHLRGEEAQLSDSPVRTKHVPLKKSLFVQREKSIQI